ncbi:hypothetical protein [Emcibacter sp. SYSU 3D8]|uniref:hypothetical protein n=1 Tax=Emcibacter sp. SYSU 3D8 TaxID=3133969 RepID=UPI0031FE9C82
MNRDRDRERYEADRRYRQENPRDGAGSPDFHESHGPRRGEPDEAPYGVGADAAYGVPADDRYFARRYRTHLPEAPRPGYRSSAPEAWDRESDRDMQRRGHFPKPGYRASAGGQTTQGGFWTADLDGPQGGPVTGDELRGHGHFLDHDYVSWREDQLRAHDRDYHEWREERRRAYDSDYEGWRRERQERFGKDFGDWRTQKQSAGEPDPTTTEGAQQRGPLTASRPTDDQRKKQDS